MNMEAEDSAFQFYVNWKKTRGFKKMPTCFPAVMSHVFKNGSELLKNRTHRGKATVFLHLNRPAGQQEKVRECLKLWRKIHENQDASGAKTRYAIPSKIGVWVYGEKKQTLTKN